jgi:hypothetical protein
VITTQQIEERELKAMLRLSEKVREAGAAFRQVNEVEGNEVAEFFEGGADKIEKAALLGMALPTWLVDIILSLLPIIVDFIIKLLKGEKTSDT